MSLTPFEHPFLSGLFGDAEISALFSVQADIAEMLRFEIALAEVTDDAAGAKALRGFTPDMAGLMEGVARDGVVVPELVRQMRAAAGPKIHSGATSQDVIDTSLVLRLKAAMAMIDTRLSDVIAALDKLTMRDGARQLTACTRMQAAIPVTVADRLESWRAPLVRYRERLAGLVYPIQFGGAAGMLDHFGADAGRVRAALAARLGLADRAQWHSQRDWPVEIAFSLSLITGSLGKMGQDVALMAQAGTEIRLSGGGGSSAMPHKQNPVSAELLVTLARFNAGQLALMNQSLVHEQERSGAAWMLEWLTLPQMVAASANALSTAIGLVGRIERLGRDGDG